MGLLDGLLGQVIGKALGGGGQAAAGQAGAAAGQAGGTGNPMLDLVMGMMTNPQSGGLQGLLGGLSQGGLGDAVKSWVGTGANIPVTGDQIHAAMGSDQIAAIAQKFGLKPEDVAGQLAQILPQAVDKVTPNGQVPDGAGLEQGIAMLRKIMG
jgi:uncharacterized protein YidB (DUF937 family)